MSMSQGGPIFIIIWILKVFAIFFKLWAAATDMRYLQGDTFFGSLVYKKVFGLIWQAVFKLGYLFCQGRKDAPFEFKSCKRQLFSVNL